MASVLSEIEYLVCTKNAEHIDILDEVFDFEPERAKAILRGIVALDSDVELRFPSGLRGDRLDSELARLLRQAGLKSVHLNIASASPRVQRLLGTNLDLPALEAGIQHLADQGIRACGHFAFGFDREDPKERERSIEFARRSALHTVKFHAEGPRRHGNRWSQRLAASARFYAGRERPRVWTAWFTDRGENHLAAHPAPDGQGSRLSSAPAPATILGCRT